MIVVLSDTHARTAPNLERPIQDAIERASCLVHAGDFVREPVLDAFSERSREIRAVFGNVDDDAIRARLPRVETFEMGTFEIAVFHTVRGGETGLATFGRSNEVDLVISGHTHQPSYTWTGTLGLLNPGSHANPRGNRPAYAEIELIDEHLRGALKEPSGKTFERFELRRELN